MCTELIIYQVLLETLYTDLSSNSPNNTMC